MPLCSEEAHIQHTVISPHQWEKHQLQKRVQRAKTYFQRQKQNLCVARKEIEKVFNEDVEKLNSLKEAQIRLFERRIAEAKGKFNEYDEKVISDVAKADANISKLDSLENTSGNLTSLRRVLKDVEDIVKEADSAVK